MRTLVLLLGLLAVASVACERVDIPVPKIPSSPSNEIAPVVVGSTASAAPSPASVASTTPDIPPLPEQERGCASSRKRHDDQLRLAGTVPQFDLVLSSPGEGRLLVEAAKAQPSAEVQIGRAHV